MKKLPGKMALGTISFLIALLPARAVEEVPTEMRHRFATKDMSATKR
jgi:hypothetical protein